MKIAICLGFSVLLGCAHEPARLAKPEGAEPAEAARPAEGANPAEATRPAEGAKPAGGTAGKIDRSGTLEQQVARLQDAYDRNAEAVDFLNKVYAQQKAQQAAQEREEIDGDGMFAVDISGEVKAGQVDGPATAPVTVVKAFDFACPYCSQMAPILTELVKEYGGKVRVVYANMVVHPVARPAHLASCAAAKQGKYKEFKDAFWDKGFAVYAASSGADQSALGEDNIVAIARGLGLDTNRLQKDMQSAECMARIDGDMAELAKFHVNATPMFFINGKPVNGAQSKEAFKEQIDEQLKIAEASGVPGADYYAKVVLARGEKQFRSKADRRH